MASWLPINGKNKETVAVKHEAGLHHLLLFPSNPVVLQALCLKDIRARPQNIEQGLSRTDGMDSDDDLGGKQIKMAFVKGRKSSVH